MVVTNNTFGTGGKGLIKLTGYNLSLSFNRIESIGQAVRNLVELGVIELLGRHANVPYWECLNIEPTNAKKQNQKHNGYKATPKTISVSHAQRMLKKLKYLSSEPTGIMDRATYAALSKFQSDNRLIATGEINYDTYEHLKQSFRGYPVNGRPVKPLPKAAPKHLHLSAPKKYSVNDMFSANIHLSGNGFLTCFHQSGRGSVRQILPIKPTVRLQVSSDQKRVLPNKQDTFSLKFEEPNKAEHILCVLQDLDSKPLFTENYEPFATLPVRNIAKLTKHFSKKANLKDWAMITRSASP